MNAQNEIIAQLTARIENMEGQLAQLLAKKATRKAKELTPQEANELRLKINAASRASKLKARAATLNMTVEQYQKYQADKKNKVVVEAPAAEPAVAETTEAVTTAPTEEPSAEQSVAEPTHEAPSTEETPVTKELPEMSLEALAASAPQKGKGKAKKAE